MKLSSPESLDLLMNTYVHCHNVTAHSWLANLHRNVFNVSETYMKHRNAEKNNNNTKDTYNGEDQIFFFFFS